jgi:hypothetical protein
MMEEVMMVDADDDGWRRCYDDMTMIFCWRDVFAVLMTVMGGDDDGYGVSGDDAYLTILTWSDDNWWCVAESDDSDQRRNDDDGIIVDVGIVSGLW